MESLPSSPIDLEEGFAFESGQDDTISVQVHSTPLLYTC